MQAIELKKGMIFNQDGKLIEVLKSNHHKPGKGNTVMQMDLRDVMSGAVVHKTMRPSEKVDLVNVSLKKAQYLYDDDTDFIFMDTDTYEQQYRLAYNTQAIPETDKITASGVKAIEGITVATDKSIPFGTKIYIDGLGERIVQDRGGAIKGNRIDLYFDSHQEALNFGRQTKEVMILN